MVILDHHFQGDRYFPQGSRIVSRDMERILLVMMRAQLCI